MAIGLPSKRNLASAQPQAMRYAGGGFKVSSLGSIENDFRGLRLKGDEMSPGRGKIYGVTKMGKKGFVTLDEIDPKDEGAIFGASEHTDTSIETDTLEAGGKGFGYFALSSTMVKEETDDEGNKFLSVYAFGRPIYFTAGGRAFKIGEEQMRCVGAFPVNQGGGGGDSIQIEGTNGRVYRTNKIKFEAYDDSNIKFDISKDAETGLVTIKVGTYWVNE